jgi:hypothetical protein
MNSTLTAAEKLRIALRGLEQREKQTGFRFLDRISAQLYTTNKIIHIEKTIYGK